MFGKALVWIIVPQNCTEYIFRQYTKMLFHLEEGIFMKTGKAPEEDLSEPEEEVSGYLLCGKIYEDRNGNGQQDEDEIGLPDIEVSVYKGDTYEPVGSVMTDSDGRYELEGLEEGSYTLEIIDDEWLDFYYDIERTVAEFPGTA